MFEYTVAFICDVCVFYADQGIVLLKHSCKTKSYAINSDCYNSWL